MSDLPELTIRPAVAADEHDWRRLWAAFNAFHGVTLFENTTATTWGRILDPASPVAALLAVESGKPVGIADYVLHDHTWGVRPCCLLDDLYVEETARGRGIGRRLVEALIDLGRQNNWSRVYWTAIEGAAAMSLYNRFWQRDRVVRYTESLIAPS